MKEGPSDVPEISLPIGTWTGPLSWVSAHSGSPALRRRPPGPSPHFSFSLRFPRHRACSRHTATISGTAQISHFSVLWTP